MTRHVCTLTAAALVALALAVPAALAAPAPASSNSVYIIRSSQATVNVDWGRLGRQFQVNASRETYLSSTGILENRVNGAVAAVSDIRYEDGGFTAFAVTCYPHGNSYGDVTLPEGALRFGPEPNEATLVARFDCSGFGVDVAELDVNLAWAADAQMNDGRSSWVGSVTGTAFDGTSNLVTSETTGSLVHATYVPVLPTG